MTVIEFIHKFPNKHLDLVDVHKVKNVVNSIVTNFPALIVNSH